MSAHMLNVGVRPRRVVGALFHHLTPSSHLPGGGVVRDCERLPTVRSIQHLFPNLSGSSERKRRLDFFDASQRLRYMLRLQDDDVKAHTHSPRGLPLDYRACQRHVQVQQLHVRRMRHLWARKTLKPEKGAAQME
jgi:hypothetical protein